MANMTAQELAETIGKFCNGASDKELEEVAEYLTTREHRTLQQRAFKLVGALIDKWSQAYQSDCFDLRNEVTCKFSNEIMTLVPDLKYVPYI